MAKAVNSTQLEVLRRFVDFEASLEEVRLRLRGILEFECAFEDGARQCNLPPPEPGANVARQRLDAALQRRWGRRISEQELTEWATRLFFERPYDWEVEDEDTNADWLNHIGLHLMGTDQ